MATTPIYAGGSRRGAAPRISTRSVEGMAALGYDEELMNQLLGSFAQVAGPTASTAAPASTGSGNYLPTLSESIGSGSSVMDLGSATADSSTAGSTTGGISPGAIGTIGSGLSALGVLGQNSDLGQLGSMLGLAGALGSAQSPEAALSIAGQVALSAAGVPGVGVATNALNGNVAGAINSALAMANPTLAAVNTISSMLGGPNVGQAAAPAVSLGVGALSDAAQIGLGSVVNAFSTPNTPEEAAAISVVDMGSTSIGTSDAAVANNSDAVNATGIEGIGLSDVNAGPPADAVSVAAPEAPTVDLGGGSSSSDTGGYDSAGDAGGYTSAPGQDAGTTSAMSGGFSDTSSTSDSSGSSSGSSGGCVIATHAVNSGAFTRRDKLTAVRWCVKHLHGKWWGEAIRRGYRYCGNKAIAKGQAHSHYQEFKDYVNFATGKQRTLATGLTFIGRSLQFLALGVFLRD